MAIKTIFIDLDDTLYPKTSGIWELIRKRIDLYMHDKLSLTWDEIPPLRQHLFQTYGTTMRGLQATYQVNDKEFLAFVHDVPVREYLSPDPVLRQNLLSLPQEKFLFTNADAGHADRVVQALGLQGCFQGITDIIDITPYCKPHPEAYRIAFQRSGVLDPKDCLLVDDAARNLATANELGCHTILIGNPAEPNGWDACIRTILDLPKAVETINERING
ncbi:MAG TPA: pyrimidine 5'-nucleotidase [Longilinea sp.]|nr:pyrimidine 5'-nucleotidase [Longilinea sp.]